MQTQCGTCVQVQVSHRRAAARLHLWRTCGFTAGGTRHRRGTNGEPAEVSVYRKEGDKDLRNTLLGRIRSKIHFILHRKVQHVIRTDGHRADGALWQWVGMTGQGAELTLQLQ